MMILLQYFAWICIFFAIAMTLTAIYMRMSRKYVRDCDDVLDRIYAAIWNGSPEDQLCAWLRVMAHLEHFRDDRELLRRAQQRYRDMERFLSETMVVSPDGRLLDFGNPAICRRRGELYIEYLKRIANKKGNI